MFHAATLFLGLVVAVRFLGPLPIARSVRYPLVLLVLVVSVHHLWSRLVFGSMFSPEVPRTVAVAVNWVFGSILLLAAFQFALDVVTLACSAVTRRSVRAAPMVRYAIGVVALSLSAFGVAQATRVPPARTVEVRIVGLPLELDGYRILQLTDLHISRLFRAPWVEAMVVAANDQRADLVVVTGDLIDGTLEARRSDVEPLGKLRARDGVFVAPGNHEYYFGQPGWMERFAELGMRPLANEHVVIRRGGTELVLAGVTDAAAGYAGLPGPDVDAALKGAPAGAPVVLLDHQPRMASQAAGAGVDLQLSGHTHGGMILGFDRIIASFNNGFVRGLYDVDGMSLYVSRGTAMWIGFAIRLGVPSEMTNIVLRAA